MRRFAALLFTASLCLAAQPMRQVGRHRVWVLEPLGDEWYRVGGH